MTKGFIMMKKKHTGSRGRTHPPHRRKRTDDMWILKLYVPGHSLRSTMAFSDLKKTCDVHLKGQYKIVIVDLLKNPRLGFDDQIISLPALVRELPRAVKKIIGELSESENVLIGLNQLPAHPD